MKNQLPLEVDQQLQTLRRQVGTSVTIGKNVLRGEFLQKNPQIQNKLKQILGKFYVRIEKDRQTRQIKFGVNGEVVKSTAFLQEFFMNLQKSAIKGYFFLGVQTPVFKDISRVQFTQLQRLELSTCYQQKSCLQYSQPLTINMAKCSQFQVNIFTKGNNKITSLKPLQKTCFSNFTSIDLDNNFFNDSTPLCRMMTVNFDPAKNSKFYIYITENKQNIGNINFILKMQNVQSSLIGENSNAGKYIKQPQVIDAIYKLQVERKQNTR